MHPTNKPFLGYKRIEDIDGECEQLCKKAIIAKLRGDEGLAEEWAQNYVRTWRAGRERVGQGMAVVEGDKGKGGLVA